jgi:hypothetical protein
VAYLVASHLFFYRIFGTNILVSRGYFEITIFLNCQPSSTERPDQVFVSSFALLLPSSAARTSIIPFYISFKKRAVEIVVEIVVTAAVAIASIAASIVATDGDDDDEDDEDDEDD